MKKTLTFKREITSNGVEHAERPHTTPDRDEGLPRHSLPQSLTFAAEGFWHVVVTQRNFRIQLVCGGVMIAAGSYFHLSAGEWGAVLAVAALVLVTEILNTALESLVDMVTMDYHPLAKVAKDVAAAAVLVAALVSVIVGGIVFLPHLWPLLPLHH